MKKLYTLMAVAALASLSVSAINFERADIKAVKAENISANITATTVKSQAKKVRHAAKPYAEAADAKALEGLFAHQAYGIFGSDQPGWEDLGASDVTVEGNKVTLSPFIYGDITLEGTYDAANQTITISKDTKYTLATSDTTTIDFGFYVADMAGETNVAKDVVFHFDAESRMITWSADVNTESYYTSALCLGLYGAPAGTQLNCYFFELESNKANTLMATAVYNDQTGQYEEDPDLYYIWLWQEGNKISINNFANFGFDNTVVFTADEATQKATSAPNSIVYAYPQFDQSGQVFYTNFYLYEVTADGPLGSTEVAFDIIEDADGFVMVNELCAMAAEGFNPIAIDQPQILLLENPYHANVADITVDNSNAPVEYFNLQGIRVANPENGLFIRRQGKQDSKVYVK